MNEDSVEQEALKWFVDLGYEVLFGPRVAPGERNAERSSFKETILQDRLRRSLKRINPQAPVAAIEEAIRKISSTTSSDRLLANRTAHKFLTEGIPVEAVDAQGELKYPLVKLVDFERPENNDWLVINQFTVEGIRNRRPDIVVFLNGLPVAIFELKNPSNEDATLDKAYDQLGTYFGEIPSLFLTNELLVISDGARAKCGCLGAALERFAAWKLPDAELIPMGELERLVRGVFEKGSFLDLLRHFTVFESAGRQDDSVQKKLAAYHQYYATNKAIKSTLCAVGGDRRAGIVWHTQGSGKSLTMAFYVGKLIATPEMANPTILVLTDRNDLDDQLFNTFCRCEALLRQTPQQAQSRKDLQEKLRNRAGGGVIFTTIQKFGLEGGESAYPILSDRENIVVVVDEAHRSQYDFIDGFAKHLRDALPKATFIGFTGTPIDRSDKSTRAIFGEYIDIYDIHQAVVDGATVPIYYESRLARIQLDEQERPAIDAEFEEVTEGQEEAYKKQLRSRWAKVEVLVGAEERLAQIARDLVEHFEKRLLENQGKALVVCMSRRICVELYSHIIRLRPNWHDDQDMDGLLKIIMTGSASDPIDWQPHIRSNAQRDAIARRLKDPADSLKMVIVRDMWLTGFDAPCLDTMYIDKPMKGHNLMQAVARVNRVHGEKPAGLVVDYIGIAPELKSAMREYSPSDQEEVGIPIDKALALLLEKLELIREMFEGTDYPGYFSASTGHKQGILCAMVDRILGEESLQDRFLKLSSEMNRAFSIAAATDEAREVAHEVALFQLIRVQISKGKTSTRRAKDQVTDARLEQLVSKAITASQGVVDICALAGVQSPEISIFSEEFLDEVRKLEHPNLAVELVRRLLNDEIKERSKKNVAQAKKFSDLLEQAIRRYLKKQVAAAETLLALIEMGKEMRGCYTRPKELGLTENEMAYYEALEACPEVEQLLGVDALKPLSREIIVAIKERAIVDWQLRDNAIADVQAAVKRLLRKAKYPLEYMDAALEAILSQARADAS